MTRKRFVKLLMSCGYSRNTAELYAHVVRKMGQTYAEQYKILDKCGYLQKKRITKQAGIAANRIGKILNAVTDAIRDAWENAWRARSC